MYWNWKKNWMFSMIFLHVTFFQFKIQAQKIKKTEIEKALFFWWSNETYGFVTFLPVCIGKHNIFINYFQLHNIYICFKVFAGARNPLENFRIIMLRIDVGEWFYFTTTTFSLFYMTPLVGSHILDDPPSRVLYFRWPPPLILPTPP